MAALSGCGGGTLVGPVPPDQGERGRVVYAALDAERTSIALLTSGDDREAPPDTLLTRAALTGARFPLSGGAFESVAWGPDGRSVAFGVVANEGAAVGIVGADGAVRAVTESTVATFRPRWSPSGRALLVDQARFLGETTGTFSVATDGTGTSECVVCETHPVQFDEAVTFVGSVEWGGTDDEIIVAVSDPNAVTASPDRYPAHVYLLDRRSLRPIERLTGDPIEGAGFALAPGGGAVAFTRGRGTDRVLYAIQPFGSDPVAVVRGADVGRYGWGRDGRLWYVVGDGGGAVLRVVSANGVALDITRQVGAVYWADSMTSPGG